MANAIGIDFGTTKTMVSYLDLTTGRPDIVCLGALQDSMPTTIYCDEAGEFLFGTAADEQIAKDPEGYCRAFKLHLGERDPILQRIEATAESLTKLFLLHVKEECEQKVFHGEPVTAATITVPVSFSPSRKAALKRAAEAAGFISVSFIPEPEAAGTAFLRENPSETFARALVLDWGGGTLDIAIVTRDADGKIHADHHCAEGRDDVGGEEIDRLLVSAGDQYWRKTFGVPLIESEEHEPRLLREAEQVKIGLSGKNTWIYRRGVKKVEVTREQFRQLIANLLDVAVDLVQSALRKNKALGNPAPDTILLIGGTSWIPAVRETMEKNFPDLRVLSWHRSQKAVALGATEVGTHASPNGNPQSGKAQAKQGALQQGGAKTSVNDKGDSFVITHAALRLFKRFAIVDGACNQREEDFMEVCSPGSTAELAWNDPSIKSESVRVLAQKTAYSYEGDEQKLFAVQGLLRALAECDGPEKPVERTALSVISLVFEKKPSSIPSFPTSQRQTLSVPNNFNKKNPCEKQVGHFDVVCPHCGHNEDVTGKGRWICDFCGNRFDVDEFRNVSLASKSENTTGKLQTTNIQPTGDLTHGWDGSLQIVTILASKVANCDYPANTAEREFMERYYKDITSMNEWREPSPVDIEEIACLTHNVCHGDQSHLAFLFEVLKGLVECDGPANLAELHALRWIKFVFGIDSESTASQTMGRLYNKTGKDVEVICPYCQTHQFVAHNGIWSCIDCRSDLNINLFSNTSVSHPGKSEVPFSIAFRKGLFGGFVMKIKNNFNVRVPLRVKSSNILQQPNNISHVLFLSQIGTAVIGWLETGRNFGLGETGLVHLIDDYDVGYQFGIDSVGNITIRNL